MDKITSRPSIQCRAAAPTVDASPTDLEMKVSSMGATRSLLVTLQKYTTRPSPAQLSNQTQTLTLG